MRKSMLIVVTAGILSFGPMAFAQDPVAKHPHLQAARGSIAEAINQLRAAKNGKAEYGGHRDRAEQLLMDADKQIVQSAEYANQHMK
jgi:hypothetical protein